MNKGKLKLNQEEGLTHIHLYTTEGNFDAITRIKLYNPNNQRALCKFDISAQVMNQKNRNVCDIPLVNCEHLDKVFCVEIDTELNLSKITAMMHIPKQPAHYLPGHFEPC